MTYGKVAGQGRDLPIALQTIYADLVERAWSGDFAQLTAGSGSVHRRGVAGRGYWYWQPPTSGGHRPPARYLGPDNDEMRGRIEAMTAEATAMKERRDMVRALRGARMPAPDRLTGEILAALAAAGVFRLRAVLIGSVAFQAYSGLIGVRLKASLAHTGDVDIAQFHSIALATEDKIDDELEAVLKRVDKNFTAIPDPIDGRRTLRYALRAGKQEVFSLDVLRPLRGPERERLTRLRAIRSHAQVMRFLDYLLYQEVNGVALYGAGIPINVPAPERYALHKLLVSQLRHAIPRSQVKAKKDIDQATALIDALAYSRPGDLADAWAELWARGPSWRAKATAALRLLPAASREALHQTIEETGAGDVWPLIV